MEKGLRKVHEQNALNRDFIAMTIPCYLMAVIYFGPKVLVLALVGVITARLTDRLAARMRARRYDRTENSSVAIALVIVMMMPVTVRLRVVIAAVLVAVLVGKEAFGGAGIYPFNPAAVGFCVAAVSWPQHMLRYPAPINWILQDDWSVKNLWALWSYEGVALSEGASMTLRNGGLPKIDFWNLLLGNYPGAMGTGCALIIMACALFLVVRQRVSVVAPGAFIAVVSAIAFFFPRYNAITWAGFPQDIMLRLQVVKFEVLSGGVVFASVFLVSEPGTLPKNKYSRLIYGVLLGVASMLFRYFGTFELGTCFVFLLVNAISGYFDRAISGAVARRAAKEVSA